LFTNLIFLILVMLLVNIAFEISTNAWIAAPIPAFLAGMGLYVALLGLIFVQDKLNKRFLRLGKNVVLGLVNIEIIGFLAVFHFILGAHRIFDYIPLLAYSDTLKTVFSLLLYFSALGFYHYISPESPHLKPSLTQALQPIRLILPFAVPFLLFTLLLDLAQLIPNKAVQDVLSSNNENLIGSFILFLVSLVFMALALVFLPPLIVWIWQCRPLEDSPLKERLDDLCKRAHFRHAGMQTWTVLNYTLTAAIVGIVPRLRYVMFTKRLLQELSPEAIEAILAHEIGHSYRRHLMIFPLIIFGMIVCTGLFSLFFGNAMNAWFELQMRAHPSQLWALSYPLAVFIPYAVIIWLYFRYVFGMFSRLFERQADLHGFELQIPPQTMIEALNDVAIATGFTHLHPNWHHYSIQERMDFLRKATKNPQVIREHHSRTRWMLFSYLIILCVATAVLIAPLLHDIFPFDRISQTENRIANSITDYFTGRYMKESLHQ